MVPYVVIKTIRNRIYSGPAVEELNCKKKIVWPVPLSAFLIENRLIFITGHKNYFTKMRESWSTSTGPHTEKPLNFAAINVSKKKIVVNTYNAEIFFYKPWIPNGYFQFEISLNVLVRCFRII